MCRAEGNVERPACAELTRRAQLVRDQSLRSLPMSETVVDERRRRAPATKLAGVGLLVVVQRGVANVPGAGRLLHGCQLLKRVLELNHGPVASGPHFTHRAL